MVFRGGRTKLFSHADEYKDVTTVADFSLSPDEQAIYRRYAGLALPRHTSYPIAPAWRDDYRCPQFREDLQRVEGPLSVYMHLPFCERLCYYCACTKEIVPAAKRREHDPAMAEVTHFADVRADHEVHQVHLGGGSPTFFRSDELTRLWQLLQSRFTIAPDAEIAVEIDPRITTREQLHRCGTSASIGSASGFRISRRTCSRRSIEFSR